MKRTFLISFLLFIVVGIKAQYPIPGASQQPAWVFPIWIEDAHGYRDTLYYGYDSLASEFIGPGYNEIQFGEYYEPLDSLGNIQAWTWINFFPSVTDSVLKVDIRNEIENQFVLGILNLYYPVTLRWDVALLRSDSLPFPPNPPLPRAQINMFWYYDPNLIPCFSNDLILITDTAQSGATCWYPDSLVIYHDLGDTGLAPGAYFELAFKPWTGIILTDIHAANESTLPGIVSNPSCNGTFALTGINGDCEIKIYSSNGVLIKELQQYVADNLIIDLSTSSNGLYILHLNNYKSTSIYKLILIK